MDTAVKVLIVAGVANIAYGFLLGFPFLAVARRGEEVSKYLRNAHVGPIMQGPMLLALTLAVDFSTLSTGTETLAAWLLAAGSILLGLGDTILWLTGVQDAAEKPSVGAALAGASTVASPIGLAIVLVGGGAGAMTGAELRLKPVEYMSEG